MPNSNAPETSPHSSWTESVLRQHLGTAKAPAALWTRLHAAPPAAARNSWSVGFRRATACTLALLALATGGHTYLQGVPRSAIPVQNVVAKKQAWTKKDWRNTKFANVVMSLNLQGACQLCHSPEEI